MRTAKPLDLERIVAFYRCNSYLPQVHGGDIVVLAERQGTLCGAVRLCEEHGLLLLRGMRIAQAAQRRGIGTQLLETAAVLVGNRECYCIPHRYLRRFYGHVGFQEIEPCAAPAFLQQRSTEYQREYDLDVIIMCRLPG